eukprot:1327410-Amorphochlora_amoeboformis.AAC.2
MIRLSRALDQYNLNSNFPSTTVEIAHTASLTSPKHINLVVSTCTSLNIYSLCHSSKPTQSVSGGEDKGDAKGKGEQQSRLVLMEEFPLLDKLEAFGETLCS